MNDNRPIEATAVMPCLNEARTLAECITKARGCFAALGVAGEVIVADNGSTDGSQELARSLGARVVEEPVKGYGAAVMAGVAAARGETIIVADADASYDWSDMGKFIDGIRAGNELVMGNRFRGGITPGAMPWHHKYIGNPVLSLLARIAYRVPIGDFHCGMRAFTRTSFRKMQLQTTGFEFCTEMVAYAAQTGLRISEVPIRLYPDGRDRRPHLRSFRDGWRHLRFILTYAPDHLYLLPGGIMFTAGVVLQALLVRGPVLLGGRYFLGIHYLALGTLLTFIGFNAVMMGLMTKVILSIKFPRLKTPLVRWAIERFHLEAGLIIAVLLITGGLWTEIVVLLQWLHGAPGAMDRNVHPSFVAANAMALGVNLLFASFLFKMLAEHHATTSAAIAPGYGQGAPGLAAK